MDKDEELNALRAEVSRLGRQCDDLTSGFVEKQTEITSLRAEVARHDDDLRMVIEQREAMRGEVERLRRNSYPHMCQDDHPRIGHAENTEPEELSCPVCAERNESASLRARAALADEVAEDVHWDNDDPQVAISWQKRYLEATKEKTDG